MSSSLTQQIITKVIGSYTVAIAVFGVIGNLITACVYLRENLRKTSTFVFTFFMVLVDILPLLFLNLSPFLQAFFGFQLQGLSQELCRLNTFVSLFGLHSSAYLLAMSTFDRFMSVWNPLWRKVYFNSKRAVIASITIIAFFFALNFHLNFTITFDYLNKNMTTMMNSTFGKCSNSPGNVFWLPISLYIWSLVPFCLLLTFNSLLLYQISVKGKIRTISKKNRSLNRVVIGLTITFIVFTLPYGLIMTYFFDVLWKTSFGQTLIYAVGSFAFTPNALNFMNQLLFNKVFVKEFKGIFISKKEKQQQSTKITTGF